MEIKHHRKSVKRTAHYYTLGHAGPDVKRCWLVCHGYGQLAKNFIRKFDVIAGAEDYVIAPEGLSRFYWGGVDGPVAASWMTRGDRLDEIDDFTQMISSIYRDEVSQLPDNVEIILFGFSQGCATQLRWMMQEKPRFDHLWLWAGFIPEDLDYLEPSAAAYLTGKQIHHFQGDGDQLIIPEYIELHRQLIQQQQLRVTEHTYAGDHRVIRKALLAFRQDLIA